MNEEIIDEESVLEYRLFGKKIEEFWNLHDNEFTANDVRSYFTFDELKTIVCKCSKGFHYNVLSYCFFLKLMNLKTLFTEEELYEIMDQNPEIIYKLTPFCSEEMLIGLVEANPKDSSMAEHVAKSLTNDEAKLKALKLAKDQYALEALIVSLESDEIKASLATKIRDKSIKSTIINSIKNEYVKERFLNPFNLDLDIICAIPDDLRKVYYLRKYGIRFKDYEKGIIIGSLKNPDLIYSLLKLYNSNVRAEAIVCLSNKISEEYIDKYINLVTNEKKMCSILLRINDKYIARYANRLNEKGIITIIKSFYNPSDRFDVISELLKNIKRDDKFIEAINSIEKLPLYKDEYIGIIERVSKYYNIDKNRLLIMVKNTSLELLKRIENKNIMRILKADQESFDNIMSLFDRNELEMNKKTMNDILYTFLQKKYRRESNDIILTLNNILIAIKNNDKDFIINKLNDIAGSISISDKINMPIDSFVELLLKNDKKALDILDSIVDEYKNFKKNQYILHYKDETEKKCVNNLVDDTTIRNIIKIYPTGFVIAFIKDFLKHHKPKTEKGLYLVKHFEIIEKTIKYFKNPKEYGKMPEDIKEYILTFYDVLIPLFDVEEFNDVKTKQEYKEIDPSFMIRVLSRLDIKKLETTLFNDPILFDELKRYVKAYKLCGWGETFDKLITDSGLVFSDEVVSSFIQYFGLCYNELKEKVENKTLDNISLTSLLSAAFCYSTSSKRYSLLFGIEDFKYLLTNPGSNAANLDKKERIKRAMEHVKTMRTRKYVTVQPMDKTFSLKNGKDINVVVGNVSNMMNLTYGERTNACMRIGGVGEGLFKFCIENENGFHIRFENPKNNKFVSRVSCFRNGNTVFLNQLRLSVDKEYDDYDIIEAAKLMAQELIELSKNTPNPIDNVVVSPAYAMVKSDMNPVDLGIKSADQGMKSFYNDIGDVGIVLASTDGGNLVPIKTGNGNLQKYPVQRDKKRVLYNNECQEYMAHLKTLDEHMAGNSIDKINIQIDKTKVMCYCGEDWYVALDNNGNIESFVMKSSNNVELAKTEMKEALESIKQKVSQELDSPNDYKEVTK